jgi:hypothetical protein
MRVCLILCDLEESTTKQPRPGPTWAVASQKKMLINAFLILKNKPEYLNK